MVILTVEFEQIVLILPNGLQVLRLVGINKGYDVYLINVEKITHSLTIINTNS